MSNGIRIRFSYQAILMLLLTGLITACGFHMRGKIELPKEMTVVYIDTSEHWLKYQLASALQTSGAKIVRHKKDATAILKIYFAGSTRSVKSVGVQGRVREYTISYGVTFGIVTTKGKTLLKRTVVSRRRDYSFSELEVVGKSVEERIILRELKREVVPDIMRHIERIGKTF